VKVSEPNRFILIGYLEEALPGDQMAKVEDMLRQSAEWRKALEEVQGDIETGEHSVAQIWRRHRLTCLTRESLGAYLADALPPDESDYVKFHLETIKCRWCQANVQDLEESAPKDADKPTAARRRRFFQTSVGHLPKK
jgi:hypothetical protein